MTTLNTITAALWRTVKFRATRTGFYRKIYMKRIHGITSRQNSKAPLSVYIEPTNRCNSNCVACPRKAMTRNEGVMDIDLFTKAVNECVKMGVKWVVLQMFGEPFMDRHFLEKARIAKSMGLKTSIYTNGALLSKRKTSRIIEENLLDHMVVSIDGVNAAEFNRSRPTLNLEQIEKNVQRLLAERERAGRTLPKIKIHCTHLPGIEYDRRAFKNKWAPMTDGVTFTPTRDWGGQIPGISTIKKPEARYPCFLLWNQFYILWDGRVTFCSIDFNGQYVLGNIRQQSLASLWQGETMAALRRQHLNGNINGHPFCRECVFSTHEKTWWWHEPENVLF